MKQNKTSKTNMETTTASNEVGTMNTEPPQATDGAPTEAAELDEMGPATKAKEAREAAKVAMKAAKEAAQLASKVEKEVEEAAKVDAGTTKSRCVSSLPTHLRK